MSNYAEIANGIVVAVIVADADFVATQTNKTYVLCIQGGVGWTYDEQANQFVAPQPYASWTLDKNNDWQPPTPMPSSGGPYRWSEEDLEWVAI